MIDMLSNAYNDNFDVAVLVAGDGDYIPLISEIKRLGKVIYLVFFLEKAYGMNPDHCYHQTRISRLGSHSSRPGRLLNVRIRFVLFSHPTGKKQCSLPASYARR